MSILSTIRSHAVLASVVTIFAVIIAVLGGRKAAEKPAAPNTSNITKVSTVNAATFRNGSAQVSGNGTVQSKSQADLKSQISAPISAVHVAIGDTVSAGEVILELENADLRAQLQSAQASLVLAQGQYSTSRQSAIDKVRDAYNKADSAVHTSIDQLISNDTGTVPPLFAYYMTDPAVGVQIRAERSDLTNIFPLWKTALDGLSATSSDQAIYSAIVLSQNNLNKISALLNNISTALTTASRAVLPSDQATISGLQTIVNGARDSVSAANSSLTSAQTSLASGSGGSAATAQVSVAQAGVNNLQAQLDKTLIRSPIYGTISALPLRVGELASPGTLLATVVGDVNHLQVKSFVSADDLALLKVGQSALIEGTVKGTVANVSPSVDASTKKAEVDIDITPTSNSGLIVGQNAAVSITTGTGTQSAGQPVTYTVPIQDVKIIPGDAFVYTISADSKIVRNEVTIGSIQGDFVEITAGLNDSMNIVTPVYELDEGQTVQAQ